MHRQIGFVMAVVVALGSVLVAQKPDAEIEALTRQYEQAFNKADAKALAALYTNDAIRLGPDGQLSTGRAMVEKNYVTAFSDGAKGAKLTLRPGRTQNVTSDVQVAEGTYQVTGGSNPGRGRYVNTLVRQNGQWRLASVVVVPEGGSKPGTTGAKP